MGLLDKLNPAQKEAVKTTEGPVMVMAGAGSGKTKVLTTRIAYLVDTLGVSPYSILAVTFTNKAAREMKDRIEAMIDIDTKYMWISTFHSFCSRLLRFEIDNLPPFNKNFTIIDDEDSLKIVKDIMKEAELDEYKPKDIRNAISNSKNFDHYSIGDPHLNECFDIVNRLYTRYLTDNNLLDFDDLIIKTIELLKKNPEICLKYQEKFQYILIDEFQDTNTLQYELMMLLCNKNRNIFVVGDDFQSIYSFRGAKIENINQFRRDFKDHKLILLEENYRSTTQILDLANNVIEKNPNQIKKVMFSKKTKGHQPVVYRFSDETNEIMYVVDKIRKLHANGDDYKDFAIMYRANYISRQFEKKLLRYQIPYKIYGGLSFFSRKEVKDVIAYIRVIVNPKDNFSFERIVNEPKRSIGKVLLNKLSEYSISQGLSMYEAISTFNESKGKGATALKEFKTTIDSIAFQLDNMNLDDLPDIILKETGYENVLKDDKETYEDRLANVKELKSELKEVSSEYEGTNTEKLINFLSDLSLRTDTDDDDLENDDRVRLTTYHQAKGLEFKNVFMVANEEGIFPSRNSTTNEEIEEERRICYVGITRAKSRLYITSAENRMLFGFTDDFTVSRFVDEMDPTLYKDGKKAKMEKNAKISTNILSPADSKPKGDNNSDIKVGCKVNHVVFGDGMVVGMQGDSIMVAFSVEYGVKKLVKNHPSIRKI